MPNVTIDAEQVRELCERYGVRELALFGSVLREDFGPGSDIDVLVEYPPDTEASLLDFVALQDDLEKVLGRRVDLVSKGGLKPHLQDRVLAQREIVMWKGMIASTV